MKINNGNRNKPRAKKKDFHRIAIWNKASSNLQSSFIGFPIIKQSILNSMANIIILSEANITEENIKNINGEFPDYDIHRKPILGSKTSRITVLTKNQGLNIQRIESLEDQSATCMWFKMRLGEKQSLLPHGTDSGINMQM